MIDRELMQQAHDALLNFENDISDAMFAALTTLRARLAQPEPPCKTGSQCIGGKCPQCVVSEWQGLTDEELKEIYRQDGVIFKPLKFYRAIEAKLKEKNT